MKPEFIFLAIFLTVSCLEYVRVCIVPLLIFLLMIMVGLAIQVSYIQS